MKGKIRITRTGYDPEAQHSRFPDSAVCTVCEVRHPIGEMLSDNEEGGFICGTCVNRLTPGHPVRSDTDG